MGFNSAFKGLSTYIPKKTTLKPTNIPFAFDLS